MRGRPLILLLLLTCCAVADGPDDGRPAPPLLPVAVHLFPGCETELRAFADLAALARRYGDDWVLFADAIEDLKIQVIACVDDSVDPDAPERLRLNRGGVGPDDLPRLSDQGHPSARLHGLRRSPEAMAAPLRAFP